MLGALHDQVPLPHPSFPPLPSPALPCPTPLHPYGRNVSYKYPSYDKFNKYGLGTVTHDAPSNTRARAARIDPQRVVSRSRPRPSECFSLAPRPAEPYPRPRYRRPPLPRRVYAAEPQWAQNVRGESSDARADNISYRFPNTRPTAPRRAVPRVLLRSRSTTIIKIIIFFTITNFHRDIQFLVARKFLSSFDFILDNNFGHRLRDAPGPNAPTRNNGDPG